MPVKQYEIIYQAAARSGFNLTEIIDFLDKNNDYE
jgi:hypothetical protein